MIHQLLEKVDALVNFERASAHCDIPCKIYDPVSAQLAALSVIRFADLIEELNGENPAQLVRLVREKEIHAEKVKQEIRVIWGDYFKAPQIEKYPDVHELAHKIKAGSDMFISTWNLHRSPELWDRPDDFDPYRFPLDEPVPTEVTTGYKYLPFGGGKRKCIGDQFALFESIVAVAMLVRRFDFAMAPGAPAVGMTTGATIHTTAIVARTGTIKRSLRMLSP